MSKGEVELLEAAGEKVYNCRTTTYGSSQGQELSNGPRSKLGGAGPPLSESRTESSTIELLQPLRTLPSNKYIEPFLDILRGKFMVNLVFTLGPLLTTFQPRSSYPNVKYSIGV